MILILSKKTKTNCDFASVSFLEDSVLSVDVVVKTNEHNQIFFLLFSWSFIKEEQRKALFTARDETILNPISDLYWSLVSSKT